MIGTIPPPLLVPPLLVPPLLPTPVLLPSPSLELPPWLMEVLVSCADEVADIIATATPAKRMDKNAFCIKIEEEK